MHVDEHAAAARRTRLRDLDVEVHGVAVELVVPGRRRRRTRPLTLALAFAFTLAFTFTFTFTFAFTLAFTLAFAFAFALAFTLAFTFAFTFTFTFTGRVVDGRRAGGEREETEEQESVTHGYFVARLAAPSTRLVAARASRKRCVMHPLVVGWFKFRNFLEDGFLGGPRAFKLAWIVNLQKGGTLPFVLGLIFTYECFTPTAWTYAAMHGSYGLIWLLKELVHPDPSFQKKMTLGSWLNAFLLVLGPYWIAPVIVTSQRVEQPLWLLALAVLAYAIGVVVMMGSDAQKFFVLRARRGLITDGWFARVRHPNYLGEMFVYGSFALVAGHWLPWAVLAWVWLAVFVPNMLRKEHSMSRYPDWAAYKARTGFLLPRLRARAAAHVGASAT
jgi:protein-S-isoprenylcysteine O-methyltransferase Ste14